MPACRCLVALLLALLGACAALPPGPHGVESHAVADGDRTTVGAAIAELAARHPGRSGFRLVAEGRTALVARAALADAAERSIDLQYYSAGDDLTSDLLLARVVAAAERGVRVRLLLDDMTVTSRTFARRAQAAHPGIQVRLFNPFRVIGASSLLRLGEFAFDGERLNRRMHNKLWITDNAVAMTGSRNLGDEYFDANPALNFLDVDLLAAGPVVAELSDAFDAYWNSAAAVPIERLAPPLGDADRAEARARLEARTQRCEAAAPCRWLAEDDWLPSLRNGHLALTWAHGHVIADSPTDDKIAESKGIAHGSVAGHPGGSAARSELLIVSPYFIPSPELHAHLGRLRGSGVRVAVLTNSLASTDVVAAHGAYARQRPGLLRLGVELYEVRPEPGVRIRHRLLRRWQRGSPAGLHAKVIVEDRARASVGSLNQDERSRVHNTEICVVLDSPEIAGRLAELFADATHPEEAFHVELQPTVDGPALRWIAQDGDDRVVFEREPLSNPWLILWRSLLGALIPEHHL